MRIKLKGGDIIEDEQLHGISPRTNKNPEHTTSSYSTRFERLPQSNATRFEHTSSSNPTRFERSPSSFPTSRCANYDAEKKVAFPPRETRRSFSLLRKTEASRISYEEKPAKECIRFDDEKATSREDARGFPVKYQQLSSDHQSTRCLDFDTLKKDLSTGGGSQKVFMSQCKESSSTPTLEQKHDKLNEQSDEKPHENNKESTTSPPMNNASAQTWVDCGYKQFGCVYQTSITEDMKNHYQYYNSLHLNLVSQWSTNVLRNEQILNDQVNCLQQSKDELENQVKVLRVENEKKSEELTSLQKPIVRKNESIVDIGDLKDETRSASPASVKGDESDSTTKQKYNITRLERAVAAKNKEIKSLFTEINKLKTNLLTCTEEKEQMEQSCIVLETKCDYIRGEFDKCTRETTAVYGTLGLKVSKEELANSLKHPKLLYEHGLSISLVDGGYIKGMLQNSENCQSYENLRNELRTAIHHYGNKLQESRQLLDETQQALSIKDTELKHVLNGIKTLQASYSGRY